MSAENLSVKSVIEKNSIAGNEPFLVLLDIEVIDPATKSVVETIRVVRNSEDFIYQNNTYAAMAFEIELKTEAGTQQAVTLKMADFTRAIQERMQAYGGGIGSNVTVTVVNAGNSDQPPEVQEFFTVTGASAQGYFISWTLGTESILAVIFPKRRELRDRCSWRYKSAQCKYAGNMPSCDLTLQGPNGCGVHSNTINFGGFPGINSNGIRYG
jgi:phage-related protein